MRTAEFNANRRGRRSSVGVFAVTYTAGGDEIVVGYVTPKRVGTAPVRNRARRRARHIVAGLAEAGVLACGHYTIMFHGPGPDSADEFTRELTAALTRVSQPRSARRR